MDDLAQVLWKNIKTNLGYGAIREKLSKIPIPITELAPWTFYVIDQPPPTITNDGKLQLNADNLQREINFIPRPNTPDCQHTSLLDIYLYACDILSRQIDGLETMKAQDIIRNDETKDNPVQSAIENNPNSSNEESPFLFATQFKSNLGSYNLPFTFIFKTSNNEELDLEGGDNTDIEFWQQPHMQQFVQPLEGLYKAKLFTFGGEWIQKLFLNPENDEIRQMGLMIIKDTKRACTELFKYMYEFYQAATSETEPTLEQYVEAGKVLWTKINQYYSILFSINIEYLSSRETVPCLLNALFLTMFIANKNDAITKIMMILLASQSITFLSRHALTLPVNPNFANIKFGESWEEMLGSMDANSMLEFASTWAKQRPKVYNIQSLHKFFVVRFMHYFLVLWLIAKSDVEAKSQLPKQTRLQMMSFLMDNVATLVEISLPELSTVGTYAKNVSLEKSKVVKSSMVYLTSVAFNSMKNLKDSNVVNNDLLYAPFLNTNIFESHETFTCAHQAIFNIINVIKNDGFFEYLTDQLVSVIKGLFTQIKESSHMSTRQIKKRM